MIVTKTQQTTQQRDQLKKKETKGLDEQTTTSNEKQTEIDSESVNKCNNYFIFYFNNLYQHLLCDNTHYMI